MEAGSVQPASTEPGTTGSVESGADSQGTTDGLFPSLDQIPSETRAHLEPVIREMQSNVGKKLEEHADYRKAWEPYEQLGINNVEPETMQQLMGLLDIMSEGKEEEFKNWWETVGNELDLFSSEEGDPDDPLYDEGGDDEGAGIEELTGVFNQLLDERLSPILQDYQQRQEQDQVTEADNMIDEQMNSIEEEHGELTEKAKAAVYKLAIAHAENDPQTAVQKAYDEFTDIIGDETESLFKSREEQPARPEGSGPANTTPDKITKFEDATAAAKARLSEMASS